MYNIIKVIKSENKMENYNAFFGDLQKLIAYKSVKDKAEENAPFGKEIKNALRFFLDRAEALGLDTVNYDDYLGEVYVGKGEEIGIIGHIDVVPDGSGWNTNPFLLTEKNGTYYGRGLSDDKTPLLLCLYILKELKESKTPLNKKYRLFIGCDEESGWQDVEYAKTKTVFPAFGFSPDGDFPVSYAEKGMAIATFSFDKPKNFTDINGGTVINAVCSFASLTAKDCGIDEKLLYKHNLMLKENNVIESIGVSAHGSRPELGKNAIKPLLQYMCDTGENYADAIEYLFNDKFGFNKIKTEQGNITLSPDIIKIQGDKMQILCDIRFPAPITLCDIKKILDKSELDYTVTQKHGTQLVEKTGNFVSTLMSAYNNVMGENLVPVSQGGSTFARVFPYGVAFGPEFPNENASIHEANEHLSKKNILKMYEIYKKAIFDLNNIEKL